MRTKMSLLLTALVFLLAGAVAAGCATKSTAGPARPGPEAVKAPADEAGGRGQAAAALRDDEYVDGRRQLPGREIYLHGGPGCGFSRSSLDESAARHRQLRPDRARYGAAAAQRPRRHPALDGVEYSRPQPRRFPKLFPAMRSNCPTAACRLTAIPDKAGTRDIVLPALRRALRTIMLLSFLPSIRSLTCPGRQRARTS